MSAPFSQTNFTADSAAQYKAKIDADLQVLAMMASDFNTHAVPAAAGTPVLGSTAGGTLAAVTYYVKIAYVTAAGETIPSAEASLAVLANNVLTVTAPSWIAEATGWNVYVSTSAGTETRQNGSTPISLSANWSEPTSGLVAGAALPAGMSRMAVIVDAGTMLVNGALVNVSAQVGATATAPTTNPRLDLIVNDALTGTVSKVTGTEAASPVLPAIPPGKYPLAQVAMSIGQTVITNSNITDLRTVFESLPDSILQQKYPFYVGTFGGTADALTVTIPSSLTTLVDGFTIIGQAALANATSTPTINVTFGSTAMGAKTIVKGSNQPVLAGDIAGANGAVQLMYSSGLAKFVLMNPNAVQAPQIVNTPLSGNTTLTAAHAGQRLTCTGTIALTLTAAATLGAGWWAYIENDGTGSVSVTSPASNITQLGGSATASNTFNVPDTGTGANPYNNSMVMIFCDGTNFAVSPVSTPHGAQTFLSNGTWVCPKGVFDVWLSGSAGGGGGGGGGGSNLSGGLQAGGGGGAGQNGTFAQRVLVSVVPGTSYSVTIGTGGTSGGGGASTPTAGSAGGTGGSTSFGALLTISGGVGGGGGAAGIVLAPGGAGYPNGGNGFNNGTTPLSGEGGGSIFAAGGVSKTGGAGNAGATPAANTGAGGGGGGGAAAQSQAGGAGGAGGTGWLTVKW